MPVSFRPASHQANQSLARPIGSDTSYVTHILEHACPSQYRQAEEILQSSFSVLSSTSKNIIPKGSGFVETVVDAYNGHQALILRPDDVWLAVLTQFNAYVNGHTEQLRSCFVAHADKKKLVVETVGNRYSVDFGGMARQMGEEIDRNVVDKDLTAWIIPDFSTTTLTDKTVGCMVMMATLKAYFSYEFGLTCGIPRVTLEGSKADWELLRSKAEKLKEYGVECIAWYHLLVPVLDGFLRAFDDPDGEQNIKFWQRIAHQHELGSGMSYLSGWITAFCVFDVDGKWVGPKLHELKPKASEREVNLATLPAKNFWTIFRDPDDVNYHGFQPLTLNDTTYHIVNMSCLPASFADVDVALNDNGEEFDCMIVAGTVGMEIRSSGDTALSAAGICDTLSPIAGWWMFIKKSDDGQSTIGTRTLVNGPVWNPDLSSAETNPYAVLKKSEEISGSTQARSNYGCCTIL